MVSIHFSVEDSSIFLVVASFLPSPFLVDLIPSTQNGKMEKDGGQVVPSPLEIIVWFFPRLPVALL